MIKNILAFWFVFAFSSVAISDGFLFIDLMEKHDSMSDIYTEMDIYSDNYQYKNFEFKLKIAPFYKISIRKSGMYFSRMATLEEMEYLKSTSNNNYVDYNAHILMNLYGNYKKENGLTFQENVICSKGTYELKYYTIGDDVSGWRISSNSEDSILLVSFSISELNQIIEPNECGKKIKDIISNY